MWARIVSSNGIVRNGLALAALATSALALTASAQPQRGPGISPEERTKVNAAQAKTVAADLKLDAEKTNQFVAAYEAFQKDAASDRPNVERGDWEAMRKHMEEQEAKLAESLKSVVDEAQAKDAAAVLGGNNRGWDRMVAVLLGFELGAEQEPNALGYTLAYVKEGLKARAGAESREDFGKMREAMAAAKKTLDENLAPLLSEEQKEKWNEATSWRGGGRGGDRGDRGREGRGEGNRGRDRGGDAS